QAEQYAEDGPHVIAAFPQPQPPQQPPQEPQHDDVEHGTPHERACKGPGPEGSALPRDLSMKIEGPAVAASGSSRSQFAHAMPTDQGPPAAGRAARAPAPPSAATPRRCAAPAPAPRTAATAASGCWSGSAPGSAAGSSTRSRNTPGRAARPAQAAEE